MTQGASPAVSRRRSKLHLMTVGTRIETSWEMSKGRRAPAFSLAAQARGPHWLLGSRSEAFREQIEEPRKASYGEGYARDFDPGRGSLLLQPPSLCAGACSPSSQHGARSGRGTEHAAPAVSHVVVFGGAFCP